MHTVLHVDDEPYILQISQWVLRQEFRVLTATSGEEALALLEAEPIDVVISDMRMPTMSGLAFLREAKRLRPGAQRILATAYTTHEDTLAAIHDVGIFKVLSKPWESDELLTLVREAVQELEKTGPAS